MQTKLYDIKDRLINRIVFIAVMFMTPVIITHMFKFLEFGKYPLIYYHTTLYVILLLLSINRKRVKMALKVHIMSGLFFLQL